MVGFDHVAAAAGIAIDNGIACDAYCHTSAPYVWAAGDCASFPWKEGRLRLESVGNAIDMAEAVAAKERSEADVASASEDVEIEAFKTMAAEYTKES